MSSQSARNLAHGGDLRLAMQKFGTPPEGWLDLSTGINPRPYPVPPVPPEAYTQLPSSSRYGMSLPLEFLSLPKEPTTGTCMIVAGPGSELIIRLLPFALPLAATVAVLGPTYGSHADAWRKAGRQVVEIASLDDLPDEADVLALANPNNPDGRRTDPATLVPMAQRLAERSGALIIDEAFADVAPEVSFGPFLQQAPAVVLRSFGKFYGLPGLRIGAAMGTSYGVLVRLSELMGAWPVSGPALTVAERATLDILWAIDTRDYLADAARRLRAGLADAGFPVVGGTDLFALVQHRDAPLLHAALAREGIWTRAFAERGDWLRFGLPPTGAFPRLERALAKIKRDGLQP